MERLIVTIMGQNCEKFLHMCLESVKDADAIVFCDGSNAITSPTRLYVVSKGCKIISNEYDQENPMMNGKQRNFYLNYLKQNYPNDWALVLDADEVVEDFGKLVSFVQEATPGLYSVKMRHFHGDLGHEDATQKEHYVLNRLFKISEAGEYPEVEHPVLQGKQETFIGQYRGTTIWHLAHIQHCFEIKKRYEKNMKHSNIHSKEFLHNWYLAHLLGQYPNSQVNPIDIPETILNYFGIDKDEFYFANRGLEVKHFIMTKQWVDYIKQKREWEIRIPSEWELSIIEYGCGLAPFGFAFINQGCKYAGIELSKFAVEHAFIPINQGNIIKDKPEGEKDLCLCFDIFEHLTKAELDIALENIKDLASYYIFSVPFRGDPNLEADKTHKIKEDRNWWMSKLSNYFNILETPKDWLFANQIIIGARK